jgi:hypothetical protein
MFLPTDPAQYALSIVCISYSTMGCVACIYEGMFVCPCLPNIG